MTKYGNQTNGFLTKLLLMKFKNSDEMGIYVHILYTSSKLKHNYLNNSDKRTKYTNEITKLEE